MARVSAQQDHLQGVLSMDDIVSAPSRGGRSDRRRDCCRAERDLRASPDRNRHGVSELLAERQRGLVLLDAGKVQRYLEQHLGGPVRLLRVSVLGHEPGTDALKGYGYGVPVKVDFEFDGTPHAAVIETVTPGPFGHEHMADRAQIVLWSHAAFNRLPRHVRGLRWPGFRTMARSFRSATSRNSSR